MPSYKAPLDDFRFLIHDLLDAVDDPDLPTGAPGTEAPTPDLIDAVLEGGARVCEQMFQPLNQSGDTEGCRFENGVVRTPAGFKAAFDAYVKGGWHTLSLDPAWGGQGLPFFLGLAMSEMTVAANHSLSTYIGLTSAVIGSLRGFGSEALKEKFIPPMVEGRWTGTMNLTEPHCGTDLRLMKTKAVRHDDGSYRVTGTKIFITAGEHDLAENIVHMVLAKVPGEGEGLGAVSLFLVPKFLVNDDGSLGQRNGVVCGGIENKMGIRGSATAQLHYEDAVGYRIGGERPNRPPAEGKEKTSAKGMAGMFAMMNAARLGVGLQGVALAEVAYQNAAAYAKERLAGRALTGAKHPELAADPIIVHPDVRRMLLHIRAFAEGARALILFAGAEITKAGRHAEPAARKRASDLAMLLTPTIKAYFTDMGFDCTNMAMQCFGGHGYIKDHGMEQFVRDARILQLYEGANGVQALDLVGRRLPVDNGEAVRALFAMIQGFIEDNKANGDLTPYLEPLGDGLNHLVGASAWLAANAPGNRDEAGGAATDFLRLLGTVLVGFMWAKMAAVAHAMLAAGDGDREFLEMKLTTGRYWMERVMPEAAMLSRRISAGSATLMAPAAAAF